MSESRQEWSFGVPARWIPVLLIALGGCASHGPGAVVGSKYVPPESGERAFVDVNNLSSYEVKVAWFENPGTCSGRNAIHYDSDRDQPNKEEIAGYQDGKPFYYRYMRVEGVGLGTGKSLRSVPLVPKVTLMEISVATPGDIRMAGAITTVKYKYCNYIFEFRPLRDQRYSFDIKADAASQQCSLNAYHELAGLDGRSTRAPLAVQPRNCQ